MDFFGAGEAIECLAAHVIAKKPVASPPLNHPVFGRCIKYTCTRDGQATITKELDPKETRCGNTLSNLNMGDTLKANSFYLLVEGFKPLKFGKTQFSGSHKGQPFETDSYTFGEISVPFSVGANIIISLPNEYVSPLKQLSSKKQD